ncbi:amino acid ABC transporter permease [Roseomonas sp. OT10]|uniref:amino acid ABC transporter permease n=1 Tax=Roseomonas cutis TaxID=2897332 RepID=UPI001E2FBAD5|nr:amino acid ABC transporter permease [Roseomonas sp. OT10]UFN48268.1 amino acid ABC transporter permease [Roseomonas sp. OT10]
MDLAVITNPEYRGLLLSGLQVTLLLFACSWLMGMALGILLTLLRALGLPPVTWLVVAYVEYHRNVPALIQLFLWYFGVAALLPPDLNDAINDRGAEVVFAIIALGCNKAAFLSEEFRTGLRAIPATQMEAARSMGLGYIGAMRWIILPQAWRLALPGLMSQTLFLFKLTSIAAAIGAAELTYEARHIEMLTFRIFETFSIVTAIYVAGSLSLMWLGAAVAHRFRLRLK